MTKQIHSLKRTAFATENFIQEHFISYNSSKFLNDMQRKSKKSKKQINAKNQNIKSASRPQNQLRNTQSKQKSNPIQSNPMHLYGKKILGPPEDWVGPAPSRACELFVRHIPTDLKERDLLAPFLRFGRIYEVRMPAKYRPPNRGYAYVKYTNAEDALCAMKVLNHFYVTDRHRFEIMRSFDITSLYITNLPKNLSEDEIREKFSSIFPKMQSIIFDTRKEQKKRGNTSSSRRKASRGKRANRRRAFIQFPNHNMASAAKRSVPTGLIRIWERNLKVVWANVNAYKNAVSSKTLFLRNIASSSDTTSIIQKFAQHVPRTSIRNVWKVGNNAFAEFSSRESAEIAFKALNCKMFNGKPLNIEWTKSSEKRNQNRNPDFDSVLRLKCIANGWGIPIIIFGSYFQKKNVQYGAIVLRDGDNNIKAIICIMNCKKLVDIHSRMCEVACALIETIGTFPDYNYIFYVESQNAHLMGLVTHNMYMTDFLASCGVPNNLCFDLYEIFDMSSAVASLCCSNEETLLSEYLKSFRTSSENSYLLNWPMLPYRMFGTIMPKYRNMPPLKNKLNDTQIVLALCFKKSGSNKSLPIRPYNAVAASAFDNGFEGLPYIVLKLLPIEVAQSRDVNAHVLSNVQFGGTAYYHPSQRIMQPPLWITGCSYNATIRQSQANTKPTENMFSQAMQETLAPYSTSFSTNQYAQHGRSGQNAQQNLANNMFFCNIPH